MRGWVPCQPWTRSLLPLGLGYDQRDSGALDFSEQNPERCPWAVATTLVSSADVEDLSKPATDTRSRGGVFCCCFFNPGFKQSHRDSVKAKGIQMRPNGEHQLGETHEKILLYNYCTTVLM